MADLRRLPPGTLPPVVLKFDASSLPVCLLTLKGQGLNETQLKDLAQFQVRNQVANVAGASVPQPFGGTYRQIQVFVDPVKLEAHQLSLTDVVTAINESNLILPAGDVRIGNRDYNIYANSQVDNPTDLNSIPLKSVGLGSIVVADVGKAEDAGAIQTNIVRIDGQKSVYIPILKQGGGSNTIEIVNGVKKIIKHLVDVPDTLTDGGGLRPVDLRESGAEEPFEGRRDRPVADGIDDPAVSWKPEGDVCGLVIDSAVGADVLPGDERHGWLHQHDAAGWPGAGVFSID